MGSGYSRSWARCPQCQYPVVRWKYVSPDSKAILVKGWKGGREGGCGWSEEVPESNEERRRFFTQPQPMRWCICQ
jgi:hypothetical protein